MSASFFKFWGKACSGGEDSQDGKPTYHLLAWHCLDVAAVAHQWWQRSPSLRRQFCQQAGLSEDQTKAWLLFFIALHDFGKFDIRFQLKSSNAWSRVNPGMSGHRRQGMDNDTKKFSHGPAAVYWFYQDQEERFKSGGDEEWFWDEDESENESWQAWLSWLAPVAGHHGYVARESDSNATEFELLPGQVHSEVESGCKDARREWLQALETLFLIPAGLSLENDPPPLACGTFLAGFCSVSDWLGSASESGRFEYDDSPADDLNEWFERRLSIAAQQLDRAGINVAKVAVGASIQSLIGDYSPRQVQSLVGDLPKSQSLVLVEAATGSGKTEAALAHAWRLLEQDLADSIVFALPTQATANAMFKRIEKAATVIFQGEINTVLAHGNARYQQEFIDLQQSVKPTTAQQSEDAWVQCAQWLAESRKRVFLGQIGICTVDQVLVSVLPVRHKFVRGFGVGRSVLIVDEVHAYDQYMYGLLEAVLKAQKAAGGSAILLSATLPDYQKQQLASVWSGQKNEVDKPEEVPYPLVSCVTESGCTPLFMGENQMPVERSVDVELLPLSEMLPDDALLERMIDAAERGAQVCLVCNLVDVAQQSLHRLQDLSGERLTDEQLILFHSRFLFADRQKKERTVIEILGPEGDRKLGHILVTTQVFECSIDACCDWMITQLCPVDLLFQRWGRLHRHPNRRPEGFERPLSTVLQPIEEDYGLHALIYGDSRILWRTQQCLAECEGRVDFPKAYRSLIESVYRQGDWGSEPEWVQESHRKFEDKQIEQRNLARRLIDSGDVHLNDTDSNVTVLTRDGEMNLSVVLCLKNSAGQRIFLDGTAVAELDDSNLFEAVSLNTVGVPRSWNYTGYGKCKNCLPESDEKGLIWLEMEPVGEQFHGVWHENKYTYSQEKGFVRVAG